MRARGYYWTRSQDGLYRVLYYSGDAWIDITGESIDPSCLRWTSGFRLSPVDAPDFSDSISITVVTK